MLGFKVLSIAALRLYFFNLILMCDFMVSCLIKYDRNFTLLALIISTLKDFI